MSLHEPVYWMVCYDIADKRRGQRVHKFFKRHGVPIQLSVYLVHATSAAMHELMRDVEPLIAKHQDDVRAYRIPVAAEVHHLGAGMLPPDVLIGMPQPAPANETRSVRADASPSSRVR